MLVTDDISSCQFQAGYIEDAEMVAEWYIIRELPLSDSDVCLLPMRGMRLTLFWLINRQN
jgi:hypothetical protein